MESVLETAAGGIGAALGTGSTSPALAHALADLLPDALFFQCAANPAFDGWASLRCGAGLFVSDDLLQPGPNELSVVSLKNSLAGLAMARQQPVIVAMSAAAAPPAVAQVVCVPVALPAGDTGAAAAQAAVASAAQAAAAGGVSPAPAAVQREAAAGRPVYVGAFMLGLPRSGGLPAPLAQALHELAAAAAPYLLLLGLTKAADMADLLRLRAADCICCGGEEDELQDLPLEACRPQMSPRSSGGGGGAAVSPFAAASPDGSCSSVSLDLEVDEAALNAAAAKALAGASHLAAPVAHTAAKAARAASGEGSSRRQRSPAAAHLQRGSEQQAKQAASEAEADPKAALRQLQSVAGEAAPPPHVPAGALLTFADSELEARFEAAHNQAQLRGDVIFALLHLAAVASLAALAPSAVTRAGAAAALALALALPLLAMALDAGRYLRQREILVSVLLLLHACLLRNAGLGALLRLLPAGRLARLPWLLSCTGAGALTLFPLGFKIRFSRFLPVHIVCLALVMSGLPTACLTSATDGCLPAGVHRAAVAALLTISGLLPVVALHTAEGHARRRFLAASTLFGSRSHLGVGAME